MKILIGGASGLVGRAILDSADFAEDSVHRLVRGKSPSAGDIQWNPMTGELDAAELDAFDVVVCLSGEGIADGRWGGAKKSRILESRVNSSTTIVRAMRKCDNPPKLFICASAIGIYGESRGDDVLDESSRLGDDFLAEVCTKWESASEELSEIGTRVVHLRLGIVLSREGGALRKMLLPFRFGLGGNLGSGGQWMSWIGIGDVIRALRFVIDDDRISGPVNVTASSPVRNQEFTRILANTFGHKPFLSIPAIVIHVAFGEMGKTLLLNGTRVVPRKLIEHGFEFEHPTIDVALDELL